MMFSFDEPVWAIFLRATAVYFILAVIMRIIPKRHAGSVSPNDLIALVIIGGLMADAIAIGSESTPGLLLMVATVFFWDYIFNLLEKHFSWFRRIAQDTPTLLIRNGRILKENLDKELMTQDELDAYLRMEGILDISKVKLAMLEVDGHVSIVKKED